MDKFIFTIVGVALLLIPLQIWYFFTHCANVKVSEMSGLCALIIYSSKN